MSFPDRYRLRPSGRASLLAIALIAVAGCRYRATYSADREQAAEHVVELLRQQHYEEIEDDLSPGVEAPGFEDELRDIGALFPAGQEPLSVRVIGWYSVHSGEAAGDSITLEYEFRKRSVDVNVTMQYLRDRWWITGLHAQARAEPLAQRNRLPARDGLWLVCAVLFGGALVYLFARSRRARPKRIPSR